MPVNFNSSAYSTKYARQNPKLQQLVAKGVPEYTVKRLLDNHRVALEDVEFLLEIGVTADALLREFNTGRPTKNVQTLMQRGMPECLARLLINKYNASLDDILCLLDAGVKVREIFRQFKTGGNSLQNTLAKTRTVLANNKQLGLLEPDIQQLMTQEKMTRSDILSLANSISKEDESWITEKRIPMTEVILLLKAEIPLNKLMLLMDKHKEASSQEVAFLLRERRLSIGEADWMLNKKISSSDIEVFEKNEIFLEDLLVLVGDLKIEKSDLLKLLEQGKTDDLPFVKSLADKKENQVKAKSIMPWLIAGYSREDAIWLTEELIPTKFLEQFKKANQDGAPIVATLKELLKDQGLNVLQVSSLLTKGITIDVMKDLRSLNIQPEEAMLMLNNGSLTAKQLAELLAKEKAGQSDKKARKLREAAGEEVAPVPVFMGPLKELITAEVEFLKTIHGFICTIYPYLEKKFSESFSINKSKTLEAIRLINNWFLNIVQNGFLNKLFPKISIDQFANMSPEMLDVLLQGIDQAQANFMLKETADYIIDGDFYNSRVIPMGNMIINQAYFNKILIESGAMQRLDSEKKVASILLSLPPALRFNNSTLSMYMQNILILPLQRLPKYELLIKEINKNCCSTGPQKEQMEEAQTKINIQCRDVNGKIGDKNDSNKIIYYNDQGKMPPKQATNAKGLGQLVTIPKVPINPSQRSCSMEATDLKMQDGGINPMPSRLVS